MDDARLRELRTSELEPTARGRAAGSALGEQIEAVLRSYLSLFETSRELGRDAVLRLGEDALTRVERWQPRLVQELEGIADGAGVAPELVGALNARTEIARAGGCSLMARLDASDGPWLAQNWDWYVDAPERCVLWTAELDDGERLLTMTEAGILAKLGVNSRGLAVGLNILHHRRDGGPMGVPIHLILRALLDSCATVEDAATLLADSPTSASSAITVDRRRGRRSGVRALTCAASRASSRGTDASRTRTTSWTRASPTARPASSTWTGAAVAWSCSRSCAPTRSRPRRSCCAITRAARSRCAATTRRAGSRPARGRAPSSRLRASRQPAVSTSPRARRAPTRSTCTSSRRWPSPA